MTRVVHVRDVDWHEDRPDLLPKGGVVYIGRPMPKTFRGSKWANPFRLRRSATDAERAECLAWYEEWLREQHDLMAALPELKGRTLACWCAPKRCHGDVLVRLVEEAVR